MSWISGLLKILIIQAIVVVCLLELIGLTQISNSYFWNHRYLYFSKDPVRDIASGLWTYTPNSNVRSVASYYLPIKGAWIEYDCRFDTNSLGLIDTNFNNENEIDWLIIGDSFTEGQGGCPWLTKESIVDSSIGNKLIINGGLMGTGVIDFLNLINYIESKKIKINNIMILAISNDFKRIPIKEGFWHNMNACLIDLKCSNKDYWWALNDNESHSSILSKTNIRVAQRGFKDDFHSLIDYYSFTYRFFLIIKSALVQYKNINILNFHPNEFDEFNIESAFHDNFAALEMIRARYPQLKLILIPQRDEVGILGRENSDSLIVTNYLHKQMINYSECKIGISDYMKVDGHPNLTGYRKIFDCVKFQIAN